MADGMEPPPFDTEEDGIKDEDDLFSDAKEVSKCVLNIQDSFHQNSMVWARPSGFRSMLISVILRMP